MAAPTNLSDSQQESGKTQNPSPLSLSLSLSLFLYMGRQAHRFRREDRRVNIHDSVRRAKCRVLSMLHRQWHPYAILYRG